MHSKHDGKSGEKLLKSGAVGGGGMAELEWGSKKIPNMLGEI